jgi:Na+/H+-dicarboxylate symporter
MSLSARVILSLLAGLGSGIAIAAADVAALERVAVSLEPIGTLWLNALRMTVIPLVVALLITAAASASETASTGKVAARALWLFIVFMSTAALLSALFIPAALAGFPVDANAAAALVAGARQATSALPELPQLRDFFINIVPANPFAAAAQGEMLPLVVFALAFGFAASRMEATRREPLLGFFQSVVDALFVLVRWILIVAPIGVFVLALGVGLRGGIGAAGAIAHYLVLVCSLSILVTLLVYPVASIAARIGVGRFARAIAPAQVVAFSTQSSVASLPAMIDRAQVFLKIPTRIAGMVLPLAVSLFRISSPPMNLAVVIFAAHVYGVPLDAARIATGAAVAVLTNFAVVGLPGQISFFIATLPIAMAMGVPVELLPLLLAVEVIPDILRTVGNVTADMAVTAIVARSQGVIAAGADPADVGPARGL